MILFINTSQINLIQLKLIVDGQIVGELESHEEFKQSELLLGMINNLIKSRGSKSEDLRLVAVVSGPGAFSALRLGVVTANTLAWSLGVPVVEVNAEEAQNDEKLIEVINQKIKKSKNQGFKPVVLKYGKEPNITKAKKQ